jgi:hypothetical protein
VDDLTLDKFFSQLNTHEQAYVEWTSEVPKRLYVNPETLGKLAAMDGFYQRPELASMVPAHSPLVRNLKLQFGVVTIIEDWEEKFYHFE